MGTQVFHLGPIQKLPKPIKNQPENQRKPEDMNDVWEVNQPIASETIKAIGRDVSVRLRQ